MSDVFIRTETLDARGSAAEPLVDALYGNRLDAVYLKQVFPQEVLHKAAHWFAREGSTETWLRPNRPVPGIDLRLLGVGAAPTATTPTGPAGEAYFAAATQTPAQAADLLGAEFDPVRAVETALARLSRKPVAVPVNQSGQCFSPFTVRALPAGEGLMIHHDNHYRLPIYEDLAPQVDTSLLLSYVVVLQHPEAGGRLCLYQAGPADDARLPKLANGMPDPVAFHRDVPHQYFDVAAGDMFVFASGRIYHTVEKVTGPLARVTLGGFFGLSADRDRCLYWS